MRKIVDYVVVEACSFAALKDIVMIALKEEWQPLGGAFQSDKIGGSSYYAQTMVKYEKD